VLQLDRLIGSIANNALITNCLLLLKYHKLNPYVPHIRLYGAASQVCFAHGSCSSRSAESK
jgi:hypothetical protein